MKEEASGLGCYPGKTSLDRAYYPCARHQQLCVVSVNHFFFLFYGYTCGIWRFPGQGWNRRCSGQPAPQPQPPRIQAKPATYNAAQGNAGSLTP